MDPEHPVNVVTQNPSVTASSGNVEHYKKNFPIRAALILSSLHLVCSALAVVCQIALIMMPGGHNGRGSGLWNGFYLSLSGSVGIYAATRPTRSKISCFKVLSIIASVVGLFPLIFFSLSLAFMVGSCKSSCDESAGESKDYIYLVYYLMGMEVFVATAGVVFAVGTSAIACKTVHFSRSETDGFVLYEEGELPAQDPVQPAGVSAGLTEAFGGPLQEPEVTGTTTPPPSYAEVVKNL